MSEADRHPQRLCCHCHDPSHLGLYLKLVKEPSLHFARFRHGQGVQCAFSSSEVGRTHLLKIENRRMAGQHACCSSQISITHFLKIEIGKSQVRSSQISITHSLKFDNGRIAGQHPFCGSQIRSRTS